MLAPLSRRERYVLGVALLALGLFVVFGQVNATDSDEGTWLRIPATTCESVDNWLNPDQASGRPNANTGNGFNPRLAAQHAGGDNALICTGQKFEQSNSIDNAALELTVFTSDDPGLQSLSLDSNAEKTPEQVNAAPRIIEPNINAGLDNLLLVEYATKNDNWQILTYLSNSSFSQPSLAIPLPSLSKFDLSELSYRVSVVASGDSVNPVYVDSFGLTYQVGAPVSLDVKLEGEDSQTRFVLSRGTPARASAKIQNSNNNSLDGLVANLPGRNSEPQSEISADVTDANGNVTKLETKKTWQGYDGDGDPNWDIEYNIPRSTDPGSYVLATEIKTSDEKVLVEKQNVLIGVMAVNVASSSYQSGQAVEFEMSVLDDRGATVCDAELNLEIIKQNRTIEILSTSNGSIAVTDTCEEYGAHIDPDYIGVFVPSGEGEYELNLSASKDGQTNLLHDYFVVNNQPDYRSTRSGPTRLFPIKDYSMSVMVKVNKDFQGQIKEYIPSSFELISQPDERAYTTNQIDDAVTELTWDVVLQAGDEIELKYTFNPPDISPEFYTIGQLELIDETGQVWQEYRQWQMVGDAVGRMMLFYDGATIPTGWTCVSCTAGDPFYQTFPRGNATYGGTGGSANHSQSATGSVAITANLTNENQAGSAISSGGHTHTFTPNVIDASNLPQYRQLKIIRYNSTGEPATLPSGVIGMFDAAVPGGWSAYSAQNGYYPRGENDSLGTTGGSNTHTHSINGSTSNSSGAADGRTTGLQASAANPVHNHTVSGNTVSINSEPPHIEVIFGQLGTSAAPPNGLIALWDDEVPANWVTTSGASGDFYQQFFKGASSYNGSSTGSSSHTHNSVNITSGGPSGTPVNRRSGSANASSTHSHTVTVSSFTTADNIPPYRDAIIGKRVPQPDITQSAYRFFENSDGTNVGTALASQDTVASSPRQGRPFRLRMLLHVDSANLSTGNRNFKLQYSQRSGTCDTSFSGESYVDVSTGSGAIRYYDNPSPSDGDNLTTNANDPTHSSDTIRAQTYEESNNFTNSVNTIQIGEDGLWDFSLVDFSATASTNYCFRVVRSNNDLLQTYDVIPEILTDDGNGHMLLLYDGGSIPSGWDCVSCNPGDDFYQRFFRGSGSYGTTGGSATHNHTASASVDTTLGLGIDTLAGTAVASGGHTHTFTPTVENASSLPTYRQLKVIRAQSSGVPSSLPQNVIAFFDASVPANWTQYSAQNGSYVRGENTVGSSGGSLTHTHNITGTTSIGSGSDDGRTNGPQVSAAAAAHSHSISGTSSSGSNEPPFVETILGQHDSAAAAPQNIIAMWDGPPPGTWTDISSSGQPFYQNFVKPAVTYGTTGGSNTHSHANNSFASNGPDNTLNRRSGTTNADGSHTHTINLSNVSTDNNLPPYTEVIFAKLGVLNTPPNDPTNLDQLRTSDDSSIAVGDYTNGGQVKLEADVTDTDNPEDLQICVEVEEVGTSFDNTPTACGSLSPYSGAAITVNVNVSGLSNGANYHWQAQTKDGSGGTSAWVSFGANPESATDFSIDSNEPSGTTYDGSTIGVDVDFNDGSLSVLDGNWNITDAESGISGYEYSVGTTPGSTDIAGWTSVGTSTSASATSLILNTSQPYYFNVRATDNAGNIIVISSDGQFVAPTLSFSSSPSLIQFNNLNASNNYSDTENSTLTTSTNAYGGYVVKAYITALPVNQASDTIQLFSGGSYASPDEWLSGDFGYGYNSNDSLIGGVNLFGSTPCAGGGNPPCYAPFSVTPPGDIVADHASGVQGTPVTDENFIITHRVTVDPSQPAGTYTTTVVYTVTARY